ncbi:MULTISPECIES: hypothetical protein [Mycobacteriales]|uniref:hypothetical protein n=1 Tax=Mycobacteriales TaxID=85007 RepID=UPI000299ADF3|nr:MULTISPECIES: hypothetical protein [Gordonia]ADK69031.2 hypothetical protein KTR9_4950 [Gordonia sp. KTR9]ART90626.1 hypothetical protein [Rhodococcus rhodochrous]MCZ4581580.1 hypothetical protein [Gordonia amicalis]OOL33111.1 Hypothetical protein GQ85_007 [Rhodococcus rhodochrous]
MTQLEVRDGVAVSRDDDSEFVPAFKDPVALRLLDRVETVVRATSPDSWWEGPTFRSPCGTKHCVLSHVAEQLGIETMEQFEAHWSTSYVIGAEVNDTPSKRYPHGHPKDRVLAYLENLRTGVEEDVLTSMDRTYTEMEPS